ncbi:zinc finger MYM-type containing 1, partial [Chelydra serpentina]
MLTYLNQRQGFGLTQKLEEQIKGEREYWQHVLQRVIAVIQTLAACGLPFWGSNDTFGSLQNGNLLGWLELVAQFDPFLAGHISKYGNAGKGSPSYLSKTICDELIGLMSDKVRSAIVDEISTAGYFSLSVDSTPDRSHIDQLSIVLRYVSPTDGKPVERFITFLNLKSHTGEEMANQVLHYLCQVCKIDFSECKGQSYDNAANMSGRYQGMEKKLLEQNKYAIFIPCVAHSLNLVSRSAVDCCPVPVSFFSTVQLLYTFFS